LEEFVLHFQIISAEPFEDLLDYVGDKKNFHVKLPIFINFLNYEQMLLALLWGLLNLDGCIFLIKTIQIFAENIILKK